MGQIASVDSQGFKEATKGSVPVLVDFWAEWCAPCRAIAPVLEELASEQEGKLKIVKVNVDEHQDVARDFAVMAIPTLILFKEGQVLTRIQGARNKAMLLAEIEPHLVGSH